MSLSLEEFKERFINDLLGIHWRHWPAVGVSSHVQPEGYWTVDLEAMIVSTLTVGLHDSRLLSASLEWLIKNGQWLNLSRLKRIVRVFMKPLPGSSEPLLTPGVFKLMTDTHNKFPHKTIFSKRSDIHDSENDDVKKYEEIFSAFQIKGVVTEPKVQQPSLLQLLLRSVFGVDARVEVLIYLLLNPGGNSNSIAREVFYDQKNVYRILGRWAKAGVVTKVAGKKIGDYYLERESEWLNVLGLKEKPGYLNWVRTFLVLDQLAKALSASPWSDDEYLLSSLFRELLQEVRLIGKPLKVRVPEPDSYPGAQYLEPFGRAVLDILGGLKGNNAGR